MSDWIDLVKALAEDVFWLRYDIDLEEAPDNIAATKVQVIMHNCQDALDQEIKRLTGKEHKTYFSEDVR